MIPFSVILSADLNWHVLYETREQNILKATFHPHAHTQHILSKHPDTDHKDSQHEAFFIEAVSKNMWSCHHAQHVRITGEGKTNMALGPCQNISHLAYMCKVSFANVAVSVRQEETRNKKL